ncbi:hypothetical protein [Candidatus Entotheonella palauensis]|uniref:hypothetical protein n=1 Tax=Candidatus Entotheonella palauensis TaxID=93172 RepID=UPI000B7DA91B|nr:hypothetical protein [Candidatus Entotheonella palauensis]
MKILICLDCDGTLFTTESLIPPVKVVQKPVPLSRLQELEAAGVQFVLVSPSSACDGLPYPRITNPDRSKALLEAAERYPSDFYIYLSDNVGDDEVSQKAGFSYIHPDHFR